MSSLIKFVAAVLLVLIILAGFVFASFNTAEVPLWLGREFSPRPVGHWVIVAFTLGGLIGLMLGFGLFSRIKSRMQIRRLNARLKAAEKELETLKKGH